MFIKNCWTFVINTQTIKINLSIKKCEIFGKRFPFRKSFAPYSIYMASQSTLGSPDRSNLVAYWSVPLLDGVHTVEFDHGTTSGKRVLRIDGKEVLHKDWMFKLVGDIKFTLGKHETKCELRVDPIAHFAFSYSLWVDGLPLEKYCEQQEKVMKSWSVVIKGKRFRIVLVMYKQPVYGFCNHLRRKKSTKDRPKKATIV
ncbi:fas apoptotic inhibitory molecule 1 isoform X2 [Cylas formicarius]|uniref:fas apoptotic inhibitory molecule 1 isoform X2 n=1 Tax=Cylas formicarius TaxID=197179 RepID=UPI002958B877|nr:fas apoptotic inhibitory molecule 1 isoform X2 [Cylas formicarius]